VNRGNPLLALGVSPFSLTYWLFADIVKELANPRGKQEKERLEYARYGYLQHSTGIQPEKGDALIKDGTMGETIQSILVEIKPEAVYFTTIEGTRGGIIVINVDEASQIPSMTEPLFLGLGATMQMQPVMIPEDLGRAAESMQQVAQKYG
jgi:hypothetical protein